MEENKTRCNSIEGIVALSLEEYSKLVRASERFEVVKQLFKNISNSYDLEKTLKSVLFENKEEEE